MTALLDANVLVALSTVDHVHHDVTSTWLAKTSEHYATTPITQGAMLRFFLREGVSTADAMAVLDSMTSSERHEFWTDDEPFSAASLSGVIGHRQVTDAYLASLARTRGSTLATLDRGLATLHKDVAYLIEARSDPTT